MKKAAYLIFVGLVFLLSACQQAFSIEGQWKTGSGETIVFQDGEVTGYLFGFKGGPNGTYNLSSEPDEDGRYLLYGSHLTGGEVEYAVEVEDSDHIHLELTENTTSGSFASSRLDLERK
ncbi:hypothetical protein [Streptococcus merionis]|uniref:hypothetical protein n=1 Tax=Streptococcus merionis TaxID=400065 RepID=UPI0035180856